MKKSLMHKNNWIITLIGILMVYLGFAIMTSITRDYDGMKAFITILLAVGGLTTVIVGLSINFHDREDGKNEQK